MVHWAFLFWPRLTGPGGILARGIALGLGAAVPIGPVNVQIARRALRQGFFAGFALGCGAVTADVTYAILSSLSLARLLNRPRVAQVIGAAGVVLLAYLAGSCFRAAARAWKSDPITSAPLDTRAVTPRSGAHSAYVTGLLMTLLNPMTLAFWFTVVPAATAAGETAGPPAGQPVRQAPIAAAAAGPQRPEPVQPPNRTKEAARNLPITCAGVFIGTVAWVVTFAGALTWAGKSRRNGWLAAADAVGGMTLLAFAAVALWRLVRPYL